MEHCTSILKCIACGGNDLVPTLDLNDQPLANNFRNAASQEHEDRYPLAVNRCEDCDHLQLTHAVDPELIYTHYLYVSGTSRTYTEYMDWYARFVREHFYHSPMSVLDIGCNDGSQLDAFRRLSMDTYGVDPAENLYPVSSAKGHQVVQGFWNQACADQLGREFDIITSQNAFAHIPDPLTYLQIAAGVLRHDGKIFISTSQADMVVNGEFDTIYHEHISFYNAESMRRLAERAGLYLVDVVKTPIHGTSYIFVLAKKPENRFHVQNILAMEAKLHQPSTYTDWATGVTALLSDLKKGIDDSRAQGYRIVGYGAAAKGMTLINAAKIEMDCVVDDNPLKQGLYCPGTSIPVVGIDYLDGIAADESVLFVPLAWNFYKEIRSKIKARRDNANDRFLRYFPKLRAE